MSRILQQGSDHSSASSVRGVMHNRRSQPGRQTGDIELAVYETYEDTFGTKATLDSVIQDISRFSVDSVLAVCSVVANGMQLWDRNEPPLEVFVTLLRIFFSPPLAQRFAINYWKRNPRRFVFHRRQILLIAKLALLHSRNDGLDLRLQGREFGTILLKASDQFHYDIPANVIEQPNKREHFARIIMEFIAVSEMSSSNLFNQLTRNHLLLTTFTGRHKSHADFVDPTQLFEREVGLTFAEWEALTFMTAAAFSKERAIRALRVKDGFWVTSRDYAATAVSYEKVSRFFGEVASDPKSFKREIEKKDFGPNDVTAFRKRPMASQWLNVGTTQQLQALLLLDTRFLFEKQIGGPYWAAFGSNPKGFPRFWGAVFESYVNTLLAEACRGSRARFIPDVRNPSKPNEQICDGVLIDGSSVVVLEYKASIFTAAAKYSGDLTLFADEIEKKLVYNDRDENRKSAAQLAFAINAFLTEDAIAESVGLQMSDIDRVYPLAVTLDSIGGTFGISAYLDLAFSEQLSLAPGARRKVSPLRCVDCDGIEAVCGYFHRLTLPDLMNLWHQADAKGLMPFIAVQFPGAHEPPIDWLLTEHNEIFKSIVGVLFPDRDPEASLKEMQRNNDMLKTPTGRLRSPRSRQS